MNMFFEILTNNTVNHVQEPFSWQLDHFLSNWEILFALFVAAYEHVPKVSSLEIVIYRN